MVDGTVKVSFQELRNASQEFNTIGGQVQTMTGNMADMVKGLDGVWTGEAAQAFKNKFNELQDDMDRMIRMVQEHSTDLQDMANRYEQAEQANIQDSSSLAGDVIS